MFVSEICHSACPESSLSVLPSFVPEVCPDLLLPSSFFWPSPASSYPPTPVSPDSVTKHQRKSGLERQKGTKDVKKGPAKNEGNKEERKEKKKTQVGGDQH